MKAKEVDIIAIGSCYVDTNVASFPFDRSDTTREEFIGQGYEIVPGGSAVNFCRLGQSLGLETGFIGMCGDDANADILQQLLGDQGVQADLIRSPELQTNIGFNISTPGGEHVMFIAGTASAALSPDKVLPKLEQVVPDARMLYMGGCFKLTSFAHAFEQIADLADQHATEIVVDHGRIPEHVTDTMRDAVKALVRRAVYYFPSREEFLGLWAVADIEVGLQELHAQAPDLTVIVKDGANGAYYWQDGSMEHVDPPKVDHVVNSTGAGDSFNAGTIAALARGLSLAQAVAYGCNVAAAKISGNDLPKL